MSILLHISDTHFGTEQPQVCAALQALSRERQPDLLVFSGDITQRAQPAQFRAARRLCESLGIARTLALPGNHDIPLLNLLARMTGPYANYLRFFGPRLEPALETDDFLVIGVNTTRASRHKHGEVSLQQVHRVARQLQGARPGQLRVVVTHHPADVTPGDERNRLRGAEHALQDWSRAGADLVLGGHIHLPYVLDLRARPQRTPRPMWCVQAGTAVSNRLRPGTRHSVNLIHWRPPLLGESRTCQVERCDYDPAQGWFATAERSSLLLG